MDPPPAPLPEAPVPMALDSSPAAAVASAAPPKPPRRHPPFSEMIVSALKSLGENKNKGWSKRAINRVIESSYTDLPAAHSELLGRHLRRMKKRGAVVMVKHSYMLPGASGVGLVKRGPGRPPKGAVRPTSAAAGGGVKRGRGRPPRAVRPIPIGGIGVGLGLAKRGRGRPRKETGPKPPKPNADVNPIPVPISSTIAEISAVARFGVGKKRLGRPPKASGPGLVKRRPGRPPKPIVPPSLGTLVVCGSESGKRRPGRPPKGLVPNPNLVVPKPNLVAPSGGDSGQTKRRPGRPPREIIAKPIVAVSNVGDSGQPKKRPGRPPREIIAKPIVAAMPNAGVEAKGGDTPKAATSSGGSGKKRGRPKKNIDLNQNIAAMATTIDLNITPVAENGLVSEEENGAAAVSEGVGVVAAAASPAGLSRGRGRPPKKAKVSGGRPVGRPKKEEVLKPAGGVVKPAVVTVPVGEA